MLFNIHMPIIFPMEPPRKKKYGLHQNQEKRLKFYNLGIICGILQQEYLKMRVKKVNIFKDIVLENFYSIETIFFDLSNFNISFMP